MLPFAFSAHVTSSFVFSVIYHPPFSSLSFDSLTSLREVIRKDVCLPPLSLLVHLHSNPIGCFLSCQQWVHLPICASPKSQCLLLCRDWPILLTRGHHSRSPSSLSCAINCLLSPRSFPWAHKTCCNFSSFQTKTKTELKPLNVDLLSHDQNQTLSGCKLFVQELLSGESCRGWEVGQRRGEVRPGHTCYLSVAWTEHFEVEIMPQGFPLNRKQENWVSIPLGPLVTLPSILC